MHPALMAHFHLPCRQPSYALTRPSPTPPLPPNRHIYLHQTQVGLAAMRESGLRGATHMFLKPVKNQNAWRLILGVLNLLQVSQHTSLCVVMVAQLL